MGVDNVDVGAATKQGIVVANAPQSNVVTAAEHTMALLLALARNVPQAHASLVAGRWERSRFSGVELMDKTLGVLGFGRIGQLVAQRAMGFGMRVIAFDPFVSAERYRELGVEKADGPDDVYAARRLPHAPPAQERPRPRAGSTPRRCAKCKDGVRVLNVARGPLIVDADLQAALDSGKVAGAALDVFRSEPVTDHPLFGYPNVIVTPHLGASTAEATDRAGYQAAEQVVAALTGGAVSTAVNVPAVAAEDLEVLGPFLPLCAPSRPARHGPRRGLVGRARRGRVPRPHRRARHPPARPRGARRRPAPATSRRTSTRSARPRSPPSGASRSSRPSAPRRATSPTSSASRSSAATTAAPASPGTTLGRQHRPHLVEAWGQRFNLQFEDDYMVLFRYRDMPGMIGRAGTCFGAHGVNINSAAVGHVPENGGNGGVAVMVLTTDAPVPEQVLDEILSDDGFFAARFVALR